VVTPIEQPLIKSVFDIINNGDINLLVKESGKMYPLIAASEKMSIPYRTKALLEFNLRQTNNYTGIFGHLRKKIDSYSNSKCPSFRSCAEAVKLKYGNVYLEVNMSKYVSILMLFAIVQIAILIFQNRLI
jgi:hypothetical protein